jgi:hypothetical protein
MHGGIFFALLNLATSEKETSESISNHISGAYSAFSGDAETKMEEMHKDFHSELNITLFHAGGPIGLVPDKIDNPVEMFSIFKQWLKSFVDDPDHMSVPFNATLAPTIIADGPLPLNAAQAEHAQDVLGVCLQQRVAAFDGLNLMNAIIHSPERYKFTAPTTNGSDSRSLLGYLVVELTGGGSYWGGVGSIAICNGLSGLAQNGFKAALGFFKPTP